MRPCLAGGGRGHSQLAPVEPGRGAGAGTCASALRDFQVTSRCLLSPNQVSAAGA